MRILIALHQVMDLGGIINHTEQLIGGLQDNDHDVDFKEFVWNTHVHPKRSEGDFLVGPSGIPHHQGKGWNFDRNDRVAYRGTAGVNTARQILKNYDLIIWTVPVPSKNKSNLGNSDWPHLYDLPKSVKQVAIIHDGNSATGYPHILHIAEHLNAVACVHACALNGADFLPCARQMIVNPQFRPDDRDTPAWTDKNSGFINMQTFKAWKHAHELIEAIAYMPTKRYGELREVAGLGIEYRYMTSEDKCKPQYFHDQSDDWWSSMKFWDAALQNGMTHHGYWNVEEAEMWMRSARVLVDPSWSKKYAAIGGHWNRVVVEAMMHGCVPVARKMGMGTELFWPGDHYVEIPQTAGPEEYAEIVLDASNMPTADADRFRRAAREILPKFDRQRVAKQFVDLAFLGSDDDQRGKPSRFIREKSADIMFNHFGVI